MAEKTPFSTLAQSDSLQIASHLKCCANCFHARGPNTDPGTHKKTMTCKALSPSLISIPVRDPATGAMSVQVHPRWPELALTEECDLFEPKPASN